MVKRIQLASGKTMIVDNQDYALATEYSWCIAGKGYARRKVTLECYLLLKWATSCEEISYIYQFST